VRWQLFQIIFVETPLVSKLFKLLRPGQGQFEAATLLQALLQHVGNPRRCWSPPGAFDGALASPSAVEQLIPHYLAHIDALGDLLTRNAPVCGAPPPGGSQKSCRELRLSGYTVREPLGAFRVTAVQILTAFSELAPERVLHRVKPAVWQLLARWFLTYRCNHIFQAACSRLWILLVRKGSPDLQHLVFVKSGLLAGLCDAVLEEGSCGDRWHDIRAVRGEPTSAVVGGSSGKGAKGAGESAATVGTRVEKVQVTTCRRRNPGGLGSFIPVLRAIESRADSGTAHLQEQLVLLGQLHPQGPPAPVARQCLGERFLQPASAPGQQAEIKPTEAITAKPVSLAPQQVQPAQQQQNYAAKLLAETPMWPQVLGAIGRGGCKVVAPAC